MSRYMLLLFILILGITQTKAQPFTKVIEFKNGMAWVKQNGKYGFINEERNLIIPCIYDSVFSFTSDYTPVKKDTNWFYIKKNGAYAYTSYQDTSQSITYAEARPFYNKYAVVREHNQERYHAISRLNGENIGHEFSCDSLGDFVKEYTKVVQKSGQGILDINGDYLVEAKYETVDSFSNGWAKVKLNGQWMTLNPYGECVKNCQVGVQLPRKRSTDWSTFYFSNVEMFWFDDINKTKLNNLVKYMKSNPKQRMLFEGNGYGSEIKQHRSGEQVNSIVNYLVKQGINREKCILRYGIRGKYRTVSIRPATSEENGPNRLPAKFGPFTMIDWINK